MHETIPSTTLFDRKESVMIVISGINHIWGVQHHYQNLSTLSHLVGVFIINS